MLAKLPFELVDAIAAFLSYRDLASLKLTCKQLAGQVQFVAVRRLNVCIDALPYESRLFHLDEPTIHGDSLEACPSNVLSAAFCDRFRHLKRLTIQLKFCTHLSSWSAIASRNSSISSCVPGRSTKEDA